MNPLIFEDYVKCFGSKTGTNEYLWINSGKTIEFILFLRSFKSAFERTKNYHLLLKYIEYKKGWEGCLFNILGLARLDYVWY